MPSYRKHLAKPAWGLYASGKLAATVRAANGIEALAQFGTLEEKALKEVERLVLRKLPEEK